MPKTRSAALVLALACAVPASAERFAAPGDASVYPIDASQFEVVVPSFKGVAMFWCGASQYARLVLDAPWDAQISISRSLGNSEVTDGRSAVQFTLQPATLGIDTFRSATPGAFPVGDTYSVSQASLGCDQLFFRLG